ncbi:DUF4214 domain-containing protein [Melaminivora suipulveris]|uniref:DUF4214 domain-containing protein n=1 Tax=Melaminivora suipulveris TaxID=2109913 RepID=UPI00131A51A3|nr:DUF4214 domain-containing protein [Melaminivora suipulveris]
MRAYVSYYGRPADYEGLVWWADRLEHEGGKLDSIIDAFGKSPEFTERYGKLTPAQLITGLFQQLFGRSPDPAGLDYYTKLLTSGQRSLQNIALDVMGGALNEDAQVLNQRLAAARRFTSGAAAPGVDSAHFDAEAMVAVLAGVDAKPASTQQACRAFGAMLATVGGTQSSGTVLAAHSTFAGNTAGTNGGAIAAAQPGAAVTAAGSVFSANVANDGGAVALNDRASLTARSRTSWTTMPAASTWGVAAPSSATTARSI